LRVGPLALAAALAALLACRGGGEARRPLTLAFFPNLTHAQALVGVREGAFSRALGPGRCNARVFDAGPAEMEALLAGDVDVAYVGAGPAAIAYLRTEGALLRIVAGAVSGGAALLSRSARAPGDLAGQRVATPQLGNTQDIALRVFLRAHGLGIGERPDEVNVTPLPPPDILALWQRGALAAAWVPEPWGARLRAEAGAHLLVDERDLWPGRRFPVTVVVARRRALEARRHEIVALLRVHLALTARWEADPAGFARAANSEYGELTHHPLPEAVLADAFSRLDPSADPLPRALEKIARRAQELGFAPQGDVRGMVDTSALREAEGAHRGEGASSPVEPRRQASP
jgi:NitT/TauT family transport system substrate-binding protein